MWTLSRACAAVIFVCASAAHAQSWTRLIEGSVTAVAHGNETFVALSENDQRSVVARLDAGGRVLDAVAIAAQRVTLLEMSGGRLLAAGSSGNELMVISELTLSLRPRWSVGVPVTRATYPSSIVATRDGGVVVAGKSDVKAFVLKLSPAGEVRWFRLYDAPYYNFFNAIRETANGYVAVGAAERSGWLVGLDREGNVLWSRSTRQGGPVEALEADGSELLAGGSIARDGGRRPWIARLDASGKPLRQMLGRDEGFKVSEITAAGGEFVILGSSLKRHVRAVLSRDGRTHRATEIVLDNPGNIQVDTYASNGLVFTTHRNQGLKAPSFIGSFERGAPAGCIQLRDMPFPFEEAQIAMYDLTLEVEVVPVKSTPWKMVVDRAVVKTEPCGTVTPSPALAQAKPQPPASAPKFEAYERKRAEWTQVMKEAAELLAARNFDEMERRAALYRRDTSDLIPFDSRLDIFYVAISDTGLQGRVTENEHRQLFDDWRKARPESLTALVGRAAFLNDLAWSKRGEASASQTPASAFEEARRLDPEIEAALKEAERASGSDPYYYLIAIDFAGRTGRRDQIRPLVMRSLSVAVFPSVFFRALEFQTSRWGGSVEAAVAFVSEAADLTRAAYGEGMYAGLARWVVSYEELWDKERFQQSKLSWPRIQQGYRDLIRRHPDWIPLYHRFAAAATVVRDRRVAGELFRMPQLEWLEFAGGWSKETWSAWREWALSAENFVDAGTWPQIVARVEGTATDGNALRGLNGFLVQTEKGVAAITVLPESLLPEVQLPTSTLMTPVRVKELTLRTPGSTAEVTTSDLPVPTAIRVHPWVAAMMPSARPVQVLQPRKLADSDGYIVTCSSGDCVQKVHAGRITVRQGSIHFQADEPLEISRVLGSPILDSSGHVVAMVIGAAEEGVRGFTIAEVVREITAAVAAPSSPR